MKENLLKIINHYGIVHQQRKLNEEVFELNEAIIKYETLKDYYFKNTNWLKEQIEEEFADVLVMLSQIKHYYNLDGENIKMIMKQKVDRQLKRIKENI